MARTPRLPAGPEFDRLATRIEAGNAALRERVEELFDHMNTRIERVEKDVSRGELGRQHILNEMAEMRRDIGEARDLTIKKDTHDVKEAARGAAEGAATVAATTVAQAAAIGPKGTHTWRWVLGVLGGIAAFGALADNLPKIVKLLTVLWVAIGGTGK